MNKLVARMKGTVKKDGGVVPFSESVWFAVAACGQNMANGMIGWFYYFCTDVAHYDLAVLGVILSIARIWDGVNDPIGGMIVDRHRFKNGEKLRPWLKYSSFAVASCIFLMFITPGAIMETKVTQAIYMALVYFIYDLTFTIQDVSLWGMTAVVSDDPDERHGFTQVARIGYQIGVWCPSLIPLIISFCERHDVPENWIFFGLSIVFGVGGMLMSALGSKAKERVITPVAQEKPKFFENLSDIYKNRTLMCLCASALLGSVVPQISQIYFFKYKVNLDIFGYQLDGMQFNFIYSLVVATPGVILMLFANKIIKKVGGLKKMYIIIFLSPIISRTLCYFIGYEGNKMFWVMIILAIMTAPLGLMDITKTSLMGDSIDYMEWKTGRRSEAITFAINTFSGKLASAIQNAVNTALLIALDYSAEAYEAGEPLSEAFDKWAWPLFMLSGVAVNALNLIPILFINYSEDKRMQVEADLKIRRAEAAALEAGEATDAPVDTSENAADDTAVEDTADETAEDSTEDAAE